MAAANGSRVPLRVEWAVYGVGGFSTTMHFMAMTIVPLLVVQLELSPIRKVAVRVAGGGVPAYYSGSPELVETVNVVSLKSSGRVAVKRQHILGNERSLV